jgi:hypothetical protein
MSRPIISSGRYPYSSVAAGFQLVTMPVGVQLRIASWDDSTIEVSRSGRAASAGGAGGGTLVGGSVRTAGWEEMLTRLDSNRYGE